MSKQGDSSKLYWRLKSENNVDDLIVSKIKRINSYNLFL